MALPFIFANSTSGKQPAANLDTNFAAVALNTVIPATATGTAAVVLTPNNTAPNQTPTIASYFDRVTLSFVMPANSTGPVTIAIAGLAAKIAYKGDASAQLDAGDLKALSLYTAVYSAGLSGGVGGFYVIGGPGTPGATGPVGPMGPAGPTGPVGPPGGTPAGSDKQVQFNDGGNFGADAGLTYDKATDALSAGKVVLAADPVNALEAATKQYVDAHASSFAAAAALRPGGRLSFIAATPVMASNVTGGTTIYYTPYASGYVPVFDGSAWSLLDISADISQLTTDTTKSPAAVVANTVYDMFVWNDAGTPRLSRGPAWASATARSLALARQNGVFVNSANITNGPLAARGTWVGTFVSNQFAATTTWVRGSSAAAGAGQATLNLWNAYNRVVTKTFVGDTSSWSYNAGPRQANGQFGNRVSFVMGNSDDDVEATYSCYLTTPAPGVLAYVGIGVNVVTGFSGIIGIAPQTGASVSAVVSSYFTGKLGIGSNYIAAMESSVGAANISFGGTTAMRLSVNLNM